MGSIWFHYYDIFICSRTTAQIIVDILSKNSVKGDLNDENARASLKAKLEKVVFNGAAGASTEKKANRLSYEVLDSVVPSQEIRYLIKALGVGGHHLEALKVTRKDLWSPGLLMEKTCVGLKVWWKLR